MDKIILYASYNSNAKCNAQMKILAEPIIAASKKASKMIDMDSSYLKIDADFASVCWDWPACLFFTWPYMTNSNHFQWDE